jgi:hypothetical protein
MVCDFYVTPPKVIDQVWHEHLLFSRGYRDFCRTILRSDFDHSPELLPTDEQTDVFQAQYDATLDAYRREFFHMPPADLWGVPKFRRNRRGSAKPKRRAGYTTSYDDAPLHQLWTGSDGGGDSGFDSADFGGGGGFSGAGSSGSWGDSGDAPAGADSTSGGDGGSCSGGSSCSSGCGGGGCGGGGD